MRIALLSILLGLWFNSEARLPDLIPYRKGNLWGYCDSTKKIVIEPQWYSVDWFEHGYARVWKNDSCGVINASGKYVVNPVHGYIMICSTDRLFVEVEERKKWNLINESGRIIRSFDAMYVIQENDSVLNVVSRKNKALVSNLDGEQIFQHEYLGWDYGFGEASKYGLYTVEDYADFKKGFWRLKNTPAFYVIDINEKPLFPGKFEWIEVFGDSLFECRVNRDSVCYYNFAGKLVEPSPIDILVLHRGKTYSSYPYPLSSEWTYIRDEDGLLDHVFLGYSNGADIQYWED